MEIIEYYIYIQLVDLIILNIIQTCIITNLSTFCKIAEGLDIPPDILLKELLTKLGKDFSFTE